MTDYDLIVIGTGSGNNIVDDRFSHLKVAIVEQDRYGGTCLNRGCIPSKMYVVPADVAEQAADGAHLDLRTSYDGVDWPAIRDRIFGRTDQVSAGGRKYREGQDFVDAISGTARFVGPRTLRVEADGRPATEISGDQIVLAVGSRPVVPDIPGLDDVDFHTSDTIMRIDALPSRLGIIGGGYVGCEFAHVFSALGSKVVQIESEDTLLLGQDAEIAETFTKTAGEHWDLRLGTSLDHVTRQGDAVTLHLDDKSAVVVDCLLLCIGRAPNTDVLDADEAGIALDDKGRVVVDEHQRARTTDETAGVWALGDASSHEPLKHVANQDARVVQHNLLHPDDLVETDHRFVPKAVFSSPQVAAVGLTEAEARDQGIELAVGRADFAGAAYGWAMEVAEGECFCKLLADRATGKLVGAHLIGPQASALIQPLILAMSVGLPVAGLARRQYWIHPAPTEVVENALLALEEALDRSAS